MGDKPFDDESRKKTIVLLTIGLVTLASALVVIFSDTVRYGCWMMVQTAIYGISSAADRQKAEQIRDEVVRVHKFAQPSISQPSGPPVFYSAGSRGLLEHPADFSIYNVTRNAEQDRILQTVRERAEQMKLPIRITFFEKENWIQSSGSAHAYRGPEHVLKVFSIDKDGHVTLLRENLLEQPVSSG